MLELYLVLCFFFGRFRQVMQSIFAAIGTSLFACLMHINQVLDVNAGIPGVKA
jgi:hypothetical protein